MMMRKSVAVRQELNETGTFIHVLRVSSSC